MATCKPSSSPYRLIARENTERYAGNLDVRPLNVNGVVVGGARPLVIAGPCAVESRTQTIEIARAVREAGGDMLRGGAFKPRTSPYEFQGMGEAGLKILAEARAETGLPIVTEALDPRQVELVGRYADVLQVGARNMQNFGLLREVGRFGKPVLLKRHWGATLNEWLCAAEYIAVEGNLDIMLCERGIRTFSQGTYNRGTLDVNVIAAVQKLTFLPVIVDPSHSTGRADLVPAAARAGCAAGANGLIIEVLGHATDPGSALCDGEQGIRPHVLAEIIREVRRAPGEAHGRPHIRAIL